MCDYAPNREAAMVVLERDAGGKATVWCDPCIAPIVRALNADGLRTIASCCGHGTRPGRIALHSGQELFILPDFDSARRADDLLTALGFPPGITDPSEPT